MRTAFIVVLSLMVVVGLEAAFHAARVVLQRRAEELKRRLQALGEPGGEEAAGLLRRGRLAATPSLAAALRTMPLAQRTEKLIEAADSQLTVAQLWAYSAASPVAALVVGLVLQLPVLPLLLLVLVAALAPTLVLAVGADRRGRKLSEQLPEALDMMARSLRAGHATPAAFQMVATEMPEPVSVEFGRAFEEQRLGLSLEQAIIHMTERSPSNRDLKIFATSAIIQKETGGNLAELLGGIAETIRARYRFQGKLRALTAEGRASGVILALLPLVFVAAIQVMNPKYFTPLFSEPAGHVILACALASWGAGILWLHRLTKVDL
jgi:tight adherence protein B